MRKYKFALIGCGRISYKHINAINEIENAELVVAVILKKKSNLSLVSEFIIKQI